MSPWIAFLAGLLSFLTPCVFSLVPAYIGYLSGRALGGESPKRSTTLLHGLFFVLGFGVVFLALGFTASVVGGFLLDYGIWLSRIGGVLMIILGLHTLNVFRIPFLDADVRKEYLPGQRGIGVASSFFMGIFFTAGWSPCVGPILGAIMTLAFAQPQQALLLLFVYWLGLAIPFLLAAAAVGQVNQWVRKYRTWSRYAQIASGVLMILLGLLFVSGQMQMLNTGFANLPILTNIQNAIDSWFMQFR